MTLIRRLRENRSWLWGLSGLAIVGAIVATAVGSQGMRPLAHLDVAPAPADASARAPLPASVSRKPEPVQVVDGKLPWSRWDPRPHFDVSATAVDLSRLVDLPPGPDDIPPIDRPRFIPADEAPWLAPTDEVIGISVGRRASRCYPLLILRWHHVVNDVLDGRSIAIYYDPATEAACGFARKANGKAISLAVSGKAWDGRELLYDGQSAGLWDPITGGKITGTGAGRGRLERVETMRTTWACWKRLHRRTEILSRNTGFGKPYSLRGGLPGEPERTTEDHRGIAPDTRVLGIRAFGAVAAVIPPEQTPSRPLRRTAEVGKKRVQITYDARTTNQTFEAAVEMMPETSWLTCSWWAWVTAYPKTTVVRLEP